MVIPTVLLLLGTLGTWVTVAITNETGHDVSQLLDDFIAFIEPIMRARGDNEIEIDGVSDSQPISGSLIEHRLMKIDHPKVQALLEDPTIPIQFSFSCEKGKFGDITTLKRVGRAVESAGAFLIQNVILKSHYSLETMYVKYPKCVISIADVPFKGQITFKAPHNNFKTNLVFYALDKYCYFTGGPTSFNGPLELKSVVQGTPYNKVFEQLIDYLIKRNPDDVKNKAKWKLQQALASAARKFKGCAFLNDRIRQHVMNKHR
ncbi:hypothetical protein GE061_007010 [Apolygus lucorum]|uniref:Uncharacterized protein n=1 Tax=Apolygus lucorum TaxID=248454 RepID=A0A8S9WQQ6_APOLU|nr:hypothetical protein GE061_007010 [Apolygus lucorum]